MENKVKFWGVAPKEYEEIQLVVENAGKQPYTVQQLIDAEQIKAVQSKYSICVDFGVDIADFADCFHPDMVALANGGAVPTRPEERVEQTCGICGVAGGVSHQQHNPLIHFVNDDKAILFCEMNDRIAFRSGVKFEGWGWYCNTYVRCEDGRWRIIKLTDSWVSTEGYIPGMEEVFNVQK